MLATPAFIMFVSPLSVPRAARQRLIQRLQGPKTGGSLRLEIGLVGRPDRTGAGEACDKRLWLLIESLLAV